MVVKDKNKGQFTQVSTKLLPMDDVVELLKYKHGFADASSLGVDSFEELALAHEGERDTVKKALGLLKTDGRTLSADELMTTEDRETLRSYSMEIRDLRDELYQLKADLGRKGLTTNYDSYAGFHETFSQGDVLYEDKPIGRVIGGSEDSNKLVFRMDDDGYDQIQKGDWIIIKFRDAAYEPVLAIVKSKATENSIHIQPYTNSALIVKIEEDQADIYKSLGQYNNGSFAFMRDQKDQLGESFVSTLDDNEYSSLGVPVFNSTGIASSFYVNNKMFRGKDTGFLTEFAVYAKKVGNPSALKAYVFKEEYLKSDSRLKFQGVKNQSFVDGTIEHLTSRVGTIDSTIKTRDGYDRMSFKFQGEDGRYNEIEAGRYVVLIAPSEGLDNDNHYLFECLQDVTGNDIQKNNALYLYAEPEAGIADEFAPIDPEIPLAEKSDADLHYELRINEVMDETITPYRSGLYTKRVLVSRDMEPRGARLVMRISREGMFVIDTEKNADTFNGAVPFTVDKRDLVWREYDHSILKGLGAMDGDKIVIGDKHVDARASLNRVITFDGSIYGKKDDEVFRVGYDIQLRPIKVEVIGEDIKSERIIARGEPIKMNLGAILRDRVKRSPKISDRLLYECEIPEDDGTNYNCFEVQIKWESGYPNGVMELGGVYNSDLYGAIQDLSFSLERRL